MPRVRISTTIDEELILKVKSKVQESGLGGVNDVLEDALRLYFANCSVTVWEKLLGAGWVKKLVVRPGKVVFESIRCRKVKEKFNPIYFTSEALELRGWKKVWKFK